MHTLSTPLTPNLVCNFVYNHKSIHRSDLCGLQTTLPSKHGFTLALWSIYEFGFCFSSDIPATIALRSPFGIETHTLKEQHLDKPT